MLALGAMPRVAAFDVPRDLYCVALEPAPLFGMPYPAGRSCHDWQALACSGVRGVLCLTGEVGYDPAPLEVIRAVSLEDLFLGHPPTDPTRELTLIRELVARVRAWLARGEGVVVHCAGGTGRTGTVLGAVLVGLGHEPIRVVGYLDQLHRARGRAGWPEARWQAQVVRDSATW